MRGDPGQSLGLGVGALDFLPLSPPDQLVVLGRLLSPFKGSVSRELSEHPLRPAQIYDDGQE